MNVTTLMEEDFSRPEMRASLDRSRQLRDAYLTAVDGVAPPAEFPVAALFHDALPRLLEEMWPRVGERYLTCVRDATITMGARHDHRVDELGFEEYLEIRRIDVLSEWVTILTEFALDLDMIDHNTPSRRRSQPQVLSTQSSIHRE
ncbi:hypothetical protein E1287_02070 [Actinomadura sp. KC06]|uniref:terpene synthase family protein n=1 Tax=Actinomadura sp. KC06 TaxID=2530369 RepID=UPI001050B880|nr:hypothetical protein [Actinomadura sp. KC06]TDD39983.1 hypothetical protein E1287_02070 [Actinomadura sp. KC06]